MISKKFKSQGFTLLEVLLVIGILSILAAIVVVAINPSKQLNDARDAQRRSDVSTILNAVYQAKIDRVTLNLPSSATEICQNATSCGATFDLYTPLSVATGKYLVAIPKDPANPAAPQTDYTIVEDGTTGRVTVASQVTPSITATK